MGHPSRVKVVGPLVPYVAGFRAELEAQGYRRHPVCDQLHVLAHLSRWMLAHGVEAGELTPERVGDFLAARRAEGYVLWCSEKGVAPLLVHLRRLGVVPVPAPVVPTTPTELLLDRYRTYLEEERGLAAATVAHDLFIAGLFLLPRTDLAGLGLDELAGKDVVTFVLSECERRSSGSARSVVTGLRSFLRYCHLAGLTPRPLAQSVPSVASWRLAGLPRALGPAEVARLLHSCDRRTTFGRRDFAVLTLLVRLGLRAGEVANLCLEDVDWRKGELVVRGKGPKAERLPLPADAGEAVAAWLRRGRPRGDAREVFTRVRAPHRGLTPGGVSSIVVAASRRAGLPEVRAHRLRHTAATEMLRAGAGLVEIGQVLRHESVLTTSIYAKVDRSSLRALAKRWPGSSEGTGR
jgi:integrase/recombinase XerD